jgi:uncharacterized protein YegP (UPF0339 family)
MSKVMRRLLLPVALAAAVALSLHPAAGQDKKAKDAKATAAKAVATFELYKDNGGKFRFRLKDDDGTELAMSPRGYETKAECQKVIDSIKSSAARATVDDQTK